MIKILEPIRIELQLGIMFPSVNSYLFPGDPLTLIDCGMDRDDNWNTLLEKLSQNGYQIKDIEQVIITHEHQDHIGLLPRILEHSNAKIKAPKMIEGWFSKPDDIRGDYIQFLEKLSATIGYPKDVLDQVKIFADHIRRYPKHENMDRFYFFEDGDKITFGGTDWDIMNTPGHCPSQFVFIDKNENRIVSSDMLLPIAPMPIVTEDQNKKSHPIRALHQLMQSFDILKKYDFKKIYPGHGPIFENANQVIDKQQNRIEMRKTECLEAVQNGFDTAYKINRYMYPYQNVPPDFSGIYMVLGYLDLLQSENLINGELNEEGVIIYKEK